MYLDESTRDISDVIECMKDVFTDMTRFRAAQRNKFRSNIQRQITL